MTGDTLLSILRGHLYVPDSASLYAALHYLKDHVKRFSHLHSLKLFSKAPSALATSVFMRITSSLKRSFAARRPS